MSLFNRPRKRNPNLLPGDAYPVEVTAAGRARLDRRMRELLVAGAVPTVPGEYVDGTGDCWTLDEDGGWTDHLGERRDPEYNALIALFGPMTPVQPARTSFEGVTTP